MNRFLGPYQERIYAVFRFVAGFLFAFHGAQKLFGLFAKPDSPPLNAMMTVAGVIELGGGILIAIGLLASWAAFLSSGEMAVAYFMVHQPNGTWPIQNGGELAALYAFVFLYIAAKGSGRWSVAALMKDPRLS
jgi:putative oxidoreductase